MTRARAETSASNVGQMLSDHQRLRGLISGVRAFLKLERPDVEEREAHDWASQLSRLLLELHDDLYQHFQLEEDTGIFEELEEKFPNAAGKLEGYELEHGQILRELRAIMAASVAYADGATPADVRLRRRITQLLDKLAAHEAGESDLMQRLHYEDMGDVD